MDPESPIVVRKRKVPPMAADQNDPFLVSPAPGFKDSSSAPRQENSFVKRLLSLRPASDSPRTPARNVPAPALPAPDFPFNFVQEPLNSSPPHKRIASSARLSLHHTQASPASSSPASSSCNYLSSSSPAPSSPAVYVLSHVSSSLAASSPPAAHRSSPAARIPSLTRLLPTPSPRHPPHPKLRLTRTSLRALAHTPPLLKRKALYPAQDEDDAPRSKRPRHASPPSSSLPPSFSALPSSEDTLVGPSSDDTHLDLDLDLAAPLSPLSALSEDESDQDSDSDSGDSGRLSDFLRRVFPPSLPHEPGFPLWYRRFPVSSFYVDAQGRPVKPLSASGAVPNAPRFVPPCTALSDADPPHSTSPSSADDPTASTRLDLYTPRFTRGRGRDKVGLCPICVEDGARAQVWLSTKFSAYNYHMMYAHGISSTTGTPFSPPVAFRTTPRPHANAKRRERAEMREGLCHRCERWVEVEGVKDVPGGVKCPEMFWWKHAAACHRDSRIAGEGGVYVDDETYRRVRAVEREEAELLRGQEE